MIHSRHAVGVLIGLAMAVQGARAADAGPARTVQSLDVDWRFINGNITGGELSTFDDAAWKKVTVPHDFSIEGVPDRGNRTGAAGGFFPAGIGWYRKHFTVAAADAARKAYVDFDGVMANSDVWINGFHLGKRPYGYVSFQYDMSGHLNAGDNVLVVKTDTSAEPASRWYAGAGIYRNVRLELENAVHLDHWGTTVTTPKISEAQATVHVRNTVVNDSAQSRDVIVEVVLKGPDGQVAAKGESKPQTVAAGKSADVELDLTVVPQIWDLDHPNMYACETHVREGTTALDDSTQSFGIRDAHFTPEAGFMLNGKTVKLKGVCIHQEMGGLGTAVPVAAWEHRLAALKETGCNAIRTAHNPMDPAFLDACDRMGFLVMDEMFDCWMAGKNTYDYHLYFKDWSVTDTRDTVRRDRNHPSIIMYSAGNEIHDTPRPAEAIPILKSLVDTFHREDPTRPVTQALFRPNSDGGGGAYKNGLSDLLDVVGTNYRYTELLAAQRAKPSISIVGTENAKDKANWLAVRDNPGYSGEFIWTGADYLGESKGWPAIMNDAGLIDITDAPHPIAYMFASWWSDQPVVKIARAGGDVPTGNIPGEPQTRAVESADWSPANTGPHQERVVVYSNAANVDLVLNGKSLGVLRRLNDGSGRTWQVAYAPGTIEAVASDATGKEIGRDVLHTAGKPAKIILSTDHASVAPVWDDIAFVTATIVDDKGVKVPLANDQINFKIAGPGKVAAVESGSPDSHEPFVSAEHHAFDGRVVALVRATAATGQITLTASAKGLADGTLTLTPAAAFTGYAKKAAK